MLAQMLANGTAQSVRGTFVAARSQALTMVPFFSYNNPQCN